MDCRLCLGTVRNILGTVLLALKGSGSGACCKVRFPRDFSRSVTVKDVVAHLLHFFRRTEHLTVHCSQASLALKRHLSIPSSAYIRDTIVSVRST